MFNQNSRQDESPSKPVTYPYLVVRIFAAVYQREGIEIRVCPPAVEIVNRRCTVQHPEPFAAEGTVIQIGSSPWRASAAPSRESNRSVKIQCSDVPISCLGGTGAPPLPGSWQSTEDRAAR
jgi:hypothetical protein